MPSGITTTPVSGLQHIDALLDEGPDWNYLTAPGNANTIYYTFSIYANTIYYTFSIASGNEKDRTGQEAFSVAQQVSGCRDCDGADGQARIRSQAFRAGGAQDARADRSTDHSRGTPASRITDQTGRRGRPPLSSQSDNGRNRPTK